VVAHLAQSDGPDVEPRSRVQTRTRRVLRPTAPRNLRTWRLNQSSDMSHTRLASLQGGTREVGNCTKCGPRRYTTQRGNASACGVLLGCAQQNTEVAIHTECRSHFCRASSRGPAYKDKAGNGRATHIWGRSALRAMHDRGRCSLQMFDHE
jgi:hypothetical protein